MQKQHEPELALLTKREAAHLLGDVSLSFLNQLIAGRKLPIVKLGYRTLRIPRSAVADFITKRTVQSR